MTVQPSSERGHVLDEKQKEIKQKIMQELMDAFYSNIEANKDILLHNPHVFSDLTLSILIMFTRDIMVHIMQIMNAQQYRKDIIKNFCEALKNEINHKIKNSLM